MLNTCLCKTWSQQLGFLNIAWQRRLVQCFPMHLNDYCSSSRLELGRIEVDMPPRRVQLLPRPEPRGIELVPSLLAKLATDYASVSGVTTHSQETTEPEVITVSEGPKGSVSRALKVHR